jgi:outer membrane PBP1 activator LpoA protein
MLKLIIIITTLALFNGCSSTPEHEKPMAPTSQETSTAPAEPPAQTPIEIEAVKSSELDLTQFLQPEEQIDLTLEQRYQLALTQQDLIDLILISELLQRQTDNPQTSSDLIDPIVKALHSAGTDTLTELAHHPVDAVQAWHFLTDLDTLSPNQRYVYAQNLTALLAPKTLAFSHLEQMLEAWRPKPLNIAVFLPFSERLSAVSERIRAGILKAYWQAGLPHTLQFYDTHNEPDLIALYHQAKQAGADHIIGPLTKTEIEQINQLLPDDLIALNDLDEASFFVQFGFKSQQEVSQIVQHLHCQNHHNLAIISSDTPSDTRLSQELQSRWVNLNHRPIHVHAFKSSNPNLRAELSKVINIDKSQSRAGFLSRSIGKPLEFFPRSRQDLDALILLGDEKHLSVLRPQLEFFDVKLPLYGSSGLTPEQLAFAPVNRDLKQIHLLSYPAALSHPKPLLNHILEAFGWDAYLLAQYRPYLTADMKLHGALGTHRITDENEVQTELVWAQYDLRGQLNPLQTPQTPFFDTQLDALRRYFMEKPKQQDLERLRQELLQEITQPHFEDHTPASSHDEKQP